MTHNQHLNDRRYEHTVDEFTDDYVLFVSEQQGHDGDALLIKHANSLRTRAMVAFISGNSDEAIRLAEREVKLLYGALGVNHPFYKTSQCHLLRFRSCGAILARTANGASVDRQSLVS